MLGFIVRVDPETDPKLMVEVVVPKREIELPTAVPVSVFPKIVLLNVLVPLKILLPLKVLFADKITKSDCPQELLIRFLSTSVKTIFRPVKPLTRIAGVVIFPVPESVRLSFVPSDTLSPKVIPELAPPKVIPAVVFENNEIALPTAVPLNVLHNRFPLKVLKVEKCYFQ